MQRNYKQFSHASSDKLIKLLNDGGIHDNTLCNEIKKVEETCQTCLRFKKPSPKPIVTFPLSQNFNDSVAMDLKFYEGKPILHLIDHCTRFSAASVIPSKQRDVIISKNFEIWITVFGSPGQILSDNRDEFSNDDFRVLGEMLNTNVRNTAAE